MLVDLDRLLQRQGSRPRVGRAQICSDRPVRKRGRSERKAQNSARTERRTHEIWTHEGFVSCQEANI